MKYKKPTSNYSLIECYPFSEKDKQTMYWEKALSRLTKTENHHKSYKMMVSSPIRYAGGKTRAVGFLLANLPKPIPKRIISPFLGGGSFEIVLANQANIQVLGYDIFDLLIDYWKYQLTKPMELYNQLLQLQPNEETYTKIRMILMNYYKKTHPEFIYDNRDNYVLTESEQTLLDHDEVKRTAYYYFNHQLSYCPAFLGWVSSVYCNDKAYQTILESIKMFQCPNLSVACDSFENVLRNHKHDFLYLDPPYYCNEENEFDSQMFKPIYPNSNFPIHSEHFDHKLLHDLLEEHQGGFIQTYNKCNKICNWYASFKQKFPKWFYSMGQGETRIGKNRLEKEEITTKKESHEVLIIGKRKE